MSVLFWNFIWREATSRCSAAESRWGSEQGLISELQVQQLKGGNSEEVPGAEADSAHEDGDILQVSREDVEVPAEAVLDSGGDFVDQYARLTVENGRAALLELVDEDGSLLRKERL